MDVGPSELLIVLVIALVLFGGAKIPQLARSLGEAQREFRRGSSGEKDEPVETPAAVAPVVVAPVASLPAATVAEPVMTPGPAETPVAETPVAEAS
jgi:TatA/E family protein of Tat protein translocase